MSANKKVAVVGAGISGLASIKACKEENLQVTCYEVTNDIGGLWKYREESIPYVAAVSKNTVMNSSKEMSAFSDFPPPSDFPIYMFHHDFHKYICLYAEKHSLTSHIRFGRRVILVKEAEDFHETGKWKIIVKVIDINVEEEDIYDAVMVCTGCYAKPLFPSVPGKESFEGNITHSHHYKESSKFKDKTVLIVGSGNSAADVAVDLCGNAKTVYMSSRNGAWIWPRIGPTSQPTDAHFTTRINVLATQYLPISLTYKRFESFMEGRFLSSRFNLSPKKGIFNSFPTVNDLLPFHIINGGIKIKGGIQRFTSDGVVFDGEKHVTHFDDVIFGTGYEIEFPFLEKQIHPSDLYLNIVHPKYSTIGFIGFVELPKGMTPIMEKQAMWYVQLLQGNAQLPSEEEMLNWISSYKRTRIDRFGENKKIPIMETYEDELAEKLGIKPNLLSMLFSDPKLFIACMTGPLLPYQYRLRGPHAWDGARDAILSYERRLFNK